MGRQLMAKFMHYAGELKLCDKHNPIMETQWIAVHVVHCCPADKGFLAISIVVAITLSVEIPVICGQLAEFISTTTTDVIELQ